MSWLYVHQGDGMFRSGRRPQCFLKLKWCFVHFLGDPLTRCNKPRMRKYFFLCPGNNRGESRAVSFMEGFERLLIVCVHLRGTWRHTVWSFRESFLRNIKLGQMVTEIETVGKTRRRLPNLLGRIVTHIAEYSNQISFVDHSKCSDIWAGLRQFLFFFRVYETFQGLPRHYRTMPWGLPRIVL